MDRQCGTFHGSPKHCFASPTQSTVWQASTSSCCSRGCTQHEQEQQTTQSEQRSGWWGACLEPVRQWASWRPGASGHCTGPQAQAISCPSSVASDAKLYVTILSWGAGHHTHSRGRHCDCPTRSHCHQQCFSGAWTATPSSPFAQQCCRAARASSAGRVRQKGEARHVAPAACADQLHIRSDDCLETAPPSRGLVMSETAWCVSKESHRRMNQKWLCISPPADVQILGLRVLRFVNGPCVATLLCVRMSMLPSPFESPAFGSMRSYVTLLAHQWPDMHVLECANMVLIETYTGLCSVYLHGCLLIVCPQLVPGIGMPRARLDPALQVFPCPQSIPFPKRCLCPMPWAGVRIGEASNPGPLSCDSPAPTRRRLRCKSPAGINSPAPTVIEEDSLEPQTQQTEEMVEGESQLLLPADQADPRRTLRPFLKVRGKRASGAPCLVGCAMVASKRAWRWQVRSKPVLSGGDSHTPEAALRIFLRTHGEALSAELVGALTAHLGVLRAHNLAFATWMEAKAAAVAPLLAATGPAISSRPCEPHVDIGWGELRELVSARVSTLRFIPRACLADFQALCLDMLSAPVLEDCTKPCLSDVFAALAETCALVTTL